MASIAPDIPAVTPVREARNRHVRYLVCVKLDGNSEENVRLQYHLDKKIKHMAIDEIDEQDHSMLMAFKTIEEAVAMAWAILKIPGSSQIVRISLHAGPVYSEEGVSGISGIAAEVARAVNSFSIAGKIYSTFQFAAILALQPNDYAVEYAGLVSVKQEAINVYQVNQQADAFDVV